MKRCLLVLAVSLAVGTLLLPASLAHAAGKGKAKKSRSSNGAASSGLSMTPRKLSSSSSNMQFGNAAKNFQSLQHVNKQTLGTSTMGNFSPMTKKKFSQSNKSLQNLQSLGSTPAGITFSNPSLNNKKFNSSITGRFSPSQPLTGKAALADQVLAGGNRNALSDNLAHPQSLGQLGNNLTAIDRGKIADAVKNGGMFPVGGDGPPAQEGIPEIGDEAPGQGNPEQGNPGQGGGGGNPPADPNCPPDDDCHHDDGHHNGCFPWWPPIVIGGGCYHDGWHHNGCYDNNVYCPPVTNITVIEQATVDQPMMQPFVDLELVDVRLVDAGDPARNLGIRYRITFRNRGTLPVGNFQLLVMASDDGSPKTGAPTASAEIVGLTAGELISIDVRLPVSADLATMNALIVALDSALQIAELDEQNNVVVLDRSKIAAADPTTVAVQ